MKDGFSILVMGRGFVDAEKACKYLNDKGGFDDFTISGHEAAFEAEWEDETLTKHDIMDIVKAELVVKPELDG